MDDQRRADMAVDQLIAETLQGLEGLAAQFVGRRSGAVILEAVERLREERAEIAARWD